MRKKLLFVCIVGLVSVSVALAGNTKKRVQYEALPDEGKPVSTTAPVTPDPQIDWSRMNPLVGTNTTLGGFYDYQSNGGAVQQIRVNPTNGKLHVTYMTSPDSTAAGLNPNRRVKYAMSSNGGVTWNNYNNVSVPSGRSGFPSIDLFRGGEYLGQPVIASHPDGTPTISKIYVEDPLAPGDFVEVSPPTVSGASLQPIWPYVATTSNGSVVIAASQNDATVTVGVGFQERADPVLTWNPSWDVWPGDIQSGGRYPVQANGTGRVGILWNTSNGTAVLGNRWRESTDHGQTWSAPVNLYPTRVAGADTFNSYVHCDFVYDGNNPLYVFSEYQVTTGVPNLTFYSQATGFKIAVPFDSTKYGPYNLTPPNPQRFHNLEMNFPSIGLSGSTIVIAYQAFQPDTDSYGFNYSDLWYVASSNGGTTWGSPQRITNTPNQDERYPSVSKWNAPGQFNMVWTQKVPGHSGLFAFPGPDGARGVDTVRTYQVFHRINPIVFTTGVEDGGAGIANSFTLDQNYPNPFNPATLIDYKVATAGVVTIKAYDILGREVATLLNEELNPGSYQVAFDGSKLASGLYMYTMTAKGFTQTRKMMLLK